MLLKYFFHLLFKEYYYFEETLEENIHQLTKAANLQMLLQFIIIKFLEVRLHFKFLKYNFAKLKYYYFFD